MFEAKRVRCNSGLTDCKTSVFTVKSLNHCPKDLNENGFSHFGMFQNVAGSTIPCFSLALMCVAQKPSPLPNFWSFHLWRRDHHVCSTACVPLIHGGGLVHLVPVPKSQGPTVIEGRCGLTCHKLSTSWAPGVWLATHSFAGSPCLALMDVSEDQGLACSCCS